MSARRGAPSNLKFDDETKVTEFRGAYILENPSLEVIPDYGNGGWYGDIVDPNGNIRTLKRIEVLQVIEFLRNRGYNVSSRRQDQSRSNL